ncbi:MAG: cob(I)yrinic acid a,c-diamide adenosyltransferase [SAR324 cluster bacterium]|nr:cob(I)yrinic acid a,c-diamide adenosyltransferase [SAR324 cluster bacterium]
MVRITKVYTKTGDTGETGLVGGRRIPKTHLRIEAYGTVDELNSVIGIARCFNSQKEPSQRRNKFELILQAIQQKLFDLGSELATYPGDEYEGQITVCEQDVQWLEEVIDAMNKEIPPLTSFILPGGSPLNAFLHQARTLCRRAEREVIRLSEKEPIGDIIIPYLNRLSDGLFVFGRWVSTTMGETEVLWEPGKGTPDWHWDE